MKSKLFTFSIGRWVAYLLTALILAACGVSPSTPVPLPTTTPIPPTMQPIPSSLSTAYPMARQDHSMVYDSGSDRVILFGGRSNGQNNFIEFLETWTFNVQTNTWTEMKPAVSPGCIFEPMVYDSQADRTIYYAGIKGSYPSYTAIGETWAYDDNANTWTNLQSINTPSGLGAGKMVYDAESDKVILFGGITGENLNQTLNETWVFDYQANAWTQMEPAVSPPVMGWPAMAYDSESDLVLVWGGFPIMSAKPGVERTSIWAYDYNSNTWTEWPNTDGPVEEYMGAMVYDPDLDLSFLYVGNQFWSYDYNNNQWRKLKDISVKPGRRTNHAMVYDSQSKYIILFGGIGNLSIPDHETWFYDPPSDEWAEAGP
jgi:N-acetylneuraminic acid mutarotase